MKPTLFLIFASIATQGMCSSGYITDLSLVRETDEKVLDYNSGPNVINRYLGLPVVDTIEELAAWRIGLIRFNINSRETTIRQALAECGVYTTGQ